MMFHQNARIFSISLMLVLVSCELGTTQMPVDKWEKMRSRTTDEKAQDDLREAIRILDDASWHDNDEWIIRYRQENNDLDPQRRSHRNIQDIVASREVRAINTLITSSLADADKKILFEKYLGHRNSIVSGLAFSQLVRDKFWTFDKANDYARQKATSEYWDILLTSLAHTTSKADKLLVARNLIATRLVSPVSTNTHYRKTPSSEINATRILLKSDNEDDYDLIRKALLRYPDAIKLWAAVGRLPVSEQIVKRARTTYYDTSKPIAIRCTAALAFARNDPKIMDDVMKHIFVYLSEFATKDISEWVLQTYRYPANPVRKEKSRRFADNDELLVPLRELPASVLESNAEQLYQYHYGAIGAAVCAILAKRIPDKFVVMVSLDNDVSKEVYGSLLIAARVKPELAEKARTMIPKVEQQRLQAQIDEQGLDSLAFPASTITLWE